MPPHVACNEHAVEFWRWAVETLGKMNVLTVADGPMLALTCTAYAEMRRLDELLYGENAKAEEVQKAKSGYLSVTPYVSMLAHARSEFYKYLSEFGLSPASRTRLKVNGSRPSDALMNFIAKKDRA